MKFSKRAFTLIELIIVIAIIAILTVAFLPTLIRGTVSARDASRKKAAKDIVTAIEAVENGDIPAGVTIGKYLNMPAVCPGSTRIGIIPPTIGYTTFGCIDFNRVDVANPSCGNRGLGVSLKHVLGRTPKASVDNLTICKTEGGFFYRAYTSDGKPSTGTNNVATNYVVAIQLEGEGNVYGAAIKTITDLINATAYFSPDSATAGGGPVANSVLWRTSPSGPPTNFYFISK